MVRLIDILKAEIAKTNRKWNFTIVLLFPVVVTIIVFSFYVKNSLGNENSGGMNHWINYSRYFLQFYYILYPLLAALIAFSLSNIEHKNNGFKQIFTFPTNKFSIYFSKVIILLFWILSSIVLAYSLLIISGNILSYIFPQLGFQDYNINQVILAFFIRTFITLVSIISIHFFLSIYWDNFIVSVGSACFMVIFGIIINSWKYSYTIPYCNLSKAFISFSQNSTLVFSKEIFWSIGFSVLFFVGGYLIMVKKSIK